MATGVGATGWRRAERDLLEDTQAGALKSISDSPGQRPEASVFSGHPPFRPRSSGLLQGGGDHALEIGPGNREAVVLLGPAHRSDNVPD